jgi:cell division septation protein DedD
MTFFMFALWTNRLVHSVVLVAVGVAALTAVAAKVEKKRIARSKTK